MMKKRRVTAALAVIGAVAGTGYASGRELVLFFAQLGQLSWAGIALASATFGLMTGGLCGYAAAVGATDFAGLCRRFPGKKTGRAAMVTHGLLLVIAALAMLRAAGRLGALTLPVRYGFLWGAALALSLALLVNAGRLRPLAGLGLLALAAGCAFYAALALDARPVRVYLQGDVRLAFEDKPAAMALLAMAYAAMNAALAAGTAIRFGRDAGSPARLGALCGGLLAALLLCANAALARGGRQLLAQALPVVLLSARWGLAGFWMCALFGFLCATCTLAAALGGLMDLVGRRGC